MISQPPTEMKETGRLGMLGLKFNQLLRFTKSLRIVKSRTLDINHTLTGTSIELKADRDITVQKQTGGQDTVWS